MTALRRLPRVSVFLLALVALSGLVAASASAGPSPRGDCLVGNLNDPVGEPVPNIYFGNETYAYLINPADQCACTEEGFVVESISQLVYFGPEQIPFDVTVKAYLLAAVWDNLTGCWVPGPILEESLPQTFQVDIPGTFLFNVPMDMTLGYELDVPYFLALHYAGGGPGMLVVDDQPASCTEFIDTGAGWEDLNTRGRPGGGKIILWGDIVCSVPVAAEDNTWSTIKALYR